MVDNYVCISDKICGFFQENRVATTFEVGEYLFAGGVLSKDNSDALREICAVLETMAGEQKISKIRRSRVKQNVGGFDCLIPENNNNLWAQTNKNILFT